MTDRFPTNVSEDGAYLGPALILVLVAAFMALAAVLSMGAVLYVGSQRTIVMPWSALARLPILKDALPDRFTRYVWLGVSLIVARWLSRPRPLDQAFRSTVRWGSVGLYRKVLTPNETILIRARSPEPGRRDGASGAERVRVLDAPGAYRTRVLPAERRLSRGTVGRRAPRPRARLARRA